MKKATRRRKVTKRVKSPPEGTWFAVPLRTHGYAVGVVARTTGTGGMLGYFFGPIRDTPPALDEVARLKAEDAILIDRFGDLGLIEGTWPIIGTDTSWRHDEWPMPELVRRDEISRTAWKVTYSDTNPAVIESETRVDYDVDLLPTGLAGAGFVEIVLTDELEEHTTSEGTWFAVPLLQGGYAVGLVTRTWGKGLMVGYFFGEVHEKLPTLDEVKHLEPEAAIHVFRTSDFGLLTGKWPILGQSDNWRREEWPMPEYLRRDVLTRKAWRVRFSDDDPGVVECETPTDYETTNLELTYLTDEDSIEMRLSKELASPRKASRRPHP